MAKSNEVNELIEMINICKSSSYTIIDKYEGDSTIIRGVSLQSFNFVMDKAISLLKDPKSSGSEDK